MAVVAVELLDHTILGEKEYDLPRSCLRARVGVDMQTRAADDNLRHEVLEVSRISAHGEYFVCVGISPEHHRRAAKLRHSLSV